MGRSRLLEGEGEGKREREGERGEMDGGREDQCHFMTFYVLLMCC